MKWAKLDEKGNIVELMDSLPKNYKNVSNFYAHEHPEKYGFYRFYEDKPAYDPKYQSLSLPIKTVADNSITIKYTVKDLPISVIKANLLKEVSLHKSKKLKTGVTLDNKIYRAETDDLLMIMSRLVAAQSGYVIPDNFCWIAVDGEAIPFTLEKLAQLNIQILKHQDTINYECNNVINLIYAAEDVNTLKKIEQDLDLIFSQSGSNQ